MPLSRRLALGVLAAAASLPVLVTARAQSRAMRIGIIGAGSLGGTVGRLWVQAGHEVMFSSRHPDELVSMTRELGSRAFVGTPRQAAEFGSIVLFAVPYSALPQLGRDLQDVLRGKIALDASNPPLHFGSNAERTALANGVGPTSANYLPGTRLVRAFSAVDSSVIERSASRQSGKVAIPLAGDDQEAVQVAVQLVRDADCEPLIVGNLPAASSFQQGSPGFRANATLPELRRLLGLPEGR